MSVTPIQNPFQGERVVGLSPPPSARVADWNRRLNLFTGRALSATALTAEQEGQAGRLALLGQTVSPGVIHGLESGLEVQGATAFLNIAAGYGICASGEDVFVARQARVPLRSLPVYTTAALLDGAPPLGTGALAARRLGPTLDTLITRNVAVPQAGVIVLQPSQVDQLGNFDAADPCEEDAASAAFSDEQLLDGARLIYYAWPDEWLLLPAPADRWRNRLAYAIFDREALNGPDQIMPWEQVGLPIALLGLDGSFNPLFLDRYAVVRRGGKSRRHTPLAPNSGHEFLWLARIQQFAEHVAGFIGGNTDPAALAAEFRYLPPAGILPTNAITFMTGDQAVDSRVAGTQFFPGTYAVNAVPVPLEQLDLIARKSGPLAEFDTFAPDQVTMVVPVPQIWYEPDLLKVLTIDPVFADTVDQFDHERSIWLKRRLDVRVDYSLMVASATGKAPVFPNPDPDAVETETVADTEIDSTIPVFTDPEQKYGTDVLNGVLVSTDVQKLKTTLSTMPGVSLDLPQLDTLGLAQFADLLQTKSDTANDKIDLGFLRIQTDIYRTRQKMLSTEAATRLAVSPALASIAQGVSAIATKDDLDGFLKNAKILLGTTGSPAPAAPSAAPASEAPASAGTGTSEVQPRFNALSSAFLSTNFVPFVETKTIAKEAVQTATFSGATSLFSAAANLNLAAAAATVGDVTQGRAIIGGGYDLRTTSVVERLQDPATAEVKDFTVASKYSAISNFKNSSVTFNGASQAGMHVGDISIPGFMDGNAEARRTFDQIDNTVLGQILGGAHDPLGANPDESRIFAAGVRAMENAIDVLRLMEARVQLYRQAAQLCRDTLTAVNANAAAAAARLQAIANALAESRHDVAFAKALMAEEQQRLGGINSRRDQILRTQVRFLAYYRPRTVEARDDLPVRSIDPGLSAPVIPACLARNLTAPDELRAYVNLLREAPLNWFRHVPLLIDKFDRLDILQTVIQNSKQRAVFKLAQAVQTPVQTAPGPLGTEIFRVYSGQQQVLNTARTATAQMDLSTFAGITWAESRNRAASLLSIGDLVDLGHYHPEVPRVSAEEIENILKISACLYSDLTGVLPVIRLNWAERLTQVGAAINLANLASLPRWGEVPVLERKEMQAIVDWLFSRINPSQPSATSHINDLVRVAILLASHAPVADIIAGDVIRDTTISPGSRIDLSADPSRVRLGMHVLVYQANKPVARAVVEDLAAGTATARVLTATAASITVSRSTKVQYATPDAFDRNPITSALL